MQEFNFIRHAEKMNEGEERCALNESGLTLSQQEKWTNAVDRLNLEDPQIRFEALPKIEELAKIICEKLPDRALLIFNSTDTPRTKLTADFLSTSVIEDAKKQGKDIRVAFIWEPKDKAKEDGSLMRVSESVGTPTMLRLMQEVEESNDDSLERYLTSGKGGFAHPKEDELVMKAVNSDLARGENSLFRKRAQVLRVQADRIKEKFTEKDLPLYFFGIGHHGSLVALDVAFNERTHYDSVDQIPQPLSVWSANLNTENES